MIFFSKKNLRTICTYSNSHQGHVIIYTIFRQKQNMYIDLDPASSVPGLVQQSTCQVATGREATQSAPREHRQCQQRQHNDLRANHRPSATHLSKSAALSSPPEHRELQPSDVLYTTVRRDGLQPQLSPAGRQRAPPSLQLLLHVPRLATQFTVCLSESSTGGSQFAPFTYDAPRQLTLRDE